MRFQFGQAVEVDMYWQEEWEPAMIVDDNGTELISVDYYGSTRRVNRDQIRMVRTEKLKLI